MQRILTEYGNIRYVDNDYVLDYGEEFLEDEIKPDEVSETLVNDSEIMNLRKVFNFYYPRYDLEAIEDKEKFEIITGIMWYLIDNYFIKTANDMEMEKDELFKALYKGIEEYIEYGRR